MSRRLGAALAAVLLLSLAGCGGEQLTLEDVDATEFAGFSGPGLEGRCPSRPDAPAVLQFGCGPAPDTGTNTSALSPGNYALMLACDGAVSYTMEAVEPAGAFKPVEVSCSTGDDPVISRRFTVPDSGVKSTSNVSTGDGWYAVALLRVVGNG